MNFASIPFLFLFLPSFFVLYFLALACRAETRSLNAIALGSSLLFYTWGAPDFIPFLLASCFIDYRISHSLGQAAQGSRRSRTLLFLAVGMNLSSLMYFKYANFFVQQTNVLLSHLGHFSIPWTEVVLPIGISFIAFEKLSYLFDVYRGHSRPAPNFPTYLLFISLFPHIIAGPIFRYHDLAGQLLHRTHTLDKIYSGILRFCSGLGKKVLLADTLALNADKAFALPSSELTFTYAWLGILCYTFQIYFDFSGYSDMAIGLGRIFGFEFKENFQDPYRANSITDFWRRWHISLSSWMREYLYIPLGGNRGSSLRVYLNLWIVFLVSGIWHGANWTFFFWGFYHGSFLALEKFGLISLLDKLPRAVRVCYSFVVVLVGWILFRATSLSQAISYFCQLFSPSLRPLRAQYLLRFDLSDRFWILFGIAAILSFFPVFSLRQKQVSSNTSTDAPQRNGTIGALCGLGALVLYIISVGALANSKFHPFIYFQF